MNNDTILLVGEKEYSGWKNIHISQSIEAISGSFSFETANNTYGDQALPILTGAACRICFETHTLITGYVDETETSIDENEFRCTVSGRDRTADIVDCSAELPSGGVKNLKLEQIIRQLIDPYSIELIVTVSTGDRFPIFKIQQGETVFEAIDRACKLRGILATTDGEGRLTLSKIGDQAADIDLVEGVNILKAAYFTSTKYRFSKYIVKGQAPGSDDSWGTKVSAPSAMVSDPRINRYRACIVVAEGQVTSQTAKTRAEWEIAVRAGRSKRLQVTVVGWKQDSGAIWRPNLLVNVTCPHCHIDKPVQLLICDVALQYDETVGRLTHLTLCSKEAYIPEPQARLNKKETTNPFALLPRN